MKKTVKIFNIVILKTLLQIVLLLINITTIPLIIKNLGATNFGILAFLKLFSHEGVFSYFEFGFQTITSKLSSGAGSDPELNQVMARKIWGFCLFGLCTSIPVSLFLLLFKVQILEHFSLTNLEIKTILPLIIWGTITGPLSVPYSVFVGFLEGKHNYNFVNTIDFAMSFMTATAFLLCAIYKKELVIFVLAEFIVVITCMLILISYSLIKFSPTFFPLRHYLNPFRDHKYEIFSLSSVKASAIIFHNSDKFIISMLLGARALGIFEILLKLPKIIKGFSAPSAQILLPLAADLSMKDDKNRMSKIATYSILGSLVISITCSTGTGFYARDIFQNFLKIEATPDFLLTFYFLLGWSCITPLTQIWSLYIANSKSLKRYTVATFISTFSKIAVMSLAYYWGNFTLGLAYLLAMIVQFPFMFSILEKIDFDLKFFIKSLKFFVYGLIFTLLINQTLTLLNLTHNAITTLIGLMTWGVMMSSVILILIFSELRTKMKKIIYRYVTW